MNLRKNLKELTAAHEILLALTARDIRAKYKQAFVGFTWAIIQPLALMTMFTLVFSRFAKIPSEGVPYPIFSYIGIIPWGFFSGGISVACSSIVANSSLITKIRMPKEVFPFAAILARGVDLAVSCVILIAMMLLFDVSFGVRILWVIPLLMVQLVFMMGISLFLSSFTVFYRDINFGIGLLMQMWMFASPVAYPTSIVPDSYLGIYMLNPMATIIDGYRKAVLHNTVPDLSSVGWISAISITLFVLSYWFFKSQESKFADLI